MTTTTRNHHKRFLLAGVALASLLLAACGSADAATLVDVVSTEANELTPWLASEGSETAYQLIFRPMLPDEVPCVEG